MQESSVLTWFDASGFTGCGAFGSGAATRQFCSVNSSVSARQSKSSAHSMADKAGGVLSVLGDDTLRFGSLCGDRHGSEAHEAVSGT